MERPNEIHVCMARTCGARGSEAVLAEIEELVSAVGSDCVVHPSGCLGNCSRGPAVRTVSAPQCDPSDPNPPRQLMYHVEINSFEASASVVALATGKKPALDSPDQAQRFAALRLARARQAARAIFHWNTALNGLAEEAAAQPALRPEYEELLHTAGFPSGLPASAPETAPSAYVEWSLESVVPASKHSALYRFVTRDKARGTPHPRGRGKRPEPSTWHTTMLALVGPNAEGPLPWVERDYTPISSAKEWEQGRAEVLVKIYARGAATSWLLRTAPKTVWLSKPVRTLSVPGLVTAEGGGEGFRPGSVLLLLAGTGVVALPQIIHHRDPLYKLGMPTPPWRQLKVPIDAVLSFREDDVLCVPQIAAYCRDSALDEGRGLRNCTLLVTAKNTESPPFPGASGGDMAEAEKELHGLENVCILRSRLNATVVSHAVARMPQPCRVVVSGPGGFNSSARELLSRFLDAENITVLPS